MSNKIAVLIFTEGDFDSVVLFDTLAEAFAFREGVATGASKYGGDGCLAVVSSNAVEDPIEECLQLACNVGRINNESEISKAIKKLAEVRVK